MGTTIRENSKLFLDEVIQKMPQYAEVVREEIMGWIGIINESDLEFSDGLGGRYDYDTYINMYNTFSKKISDNIENLNTMKSLPVSSITDGLQFAVDESLSSMIESLCDNFRPGSTLHKNVPSADIDMFWDIYEQFDLE